MKPLMLFMSFMLFISNAYAREDINSIELPSDLIYLSAGVCPSGSRLIDYDEASYQSIRKRISELTYRSLWGFFTVLDGRYESGNYGHILNKIGRRDSLSQLSQFCVETMKETPSNEGIRIFNARTVKDLLVGNDNKLCAIFAQEGVHSVVGGCIGNKESNVKYHESYEAFRTMLTTAYLSQRNVDIVLDPNQTHFNFTAPLFSTYTIKSIMAVSK
ncbi:hypothetical protein [Candidatus Enterovibrio escicola]|uniref:Bordetella pertussis toxin B subunit 2/3 C-terminal domain-containing protein n=2 Tax=Candidatus Enterovibrio escicola TaxID=1927127 RepID=A0A2A5T5M3_9GAMM|nr:hypothetical protein [Candidatus Enterovibrio escacola]PCS23475.1 hypothetical protein BTN49_0443 [Candidatus Enterovibrio escacola]